MRDPARIPRLLAKIQKLWERQPDLRLCQLIENIVAMEGRQTREANGEQPELYFLEDADLEQWLDTRLGS